MFSVLNQTEDRCAETIVTKSYCIDPTVPYRLGLLKSSVHRYMYHHLVILHCITGLHIPREILHFNADWSWADRWINQFNVQDEKNMRNEMAFEIRQGLIKQWNGEIYSSTKCQHVNFSWYQISDCSIPYIQYQYIV